MTAEPDSRRAALDAARLVLDRMGLAIEDLMSADAVRPPAPTFSEYIPRVAETVTPGTCRVYDSYWRRVLAVWGDRRLDEPTASEIAQLAARVKANVVSRRSGRGGRSAAEHLIAALRCVYRYAIADGLIAEADNPAAKARKPRRLPSSRRGLPDDQIAEINRVAAATGNDPALDCLLLRLHTETACRRGGALAIRPRDLDTEQCLVRLREKGETERWQPVSPMLMAHLVAHGTARGASDPEGQLLRYSSGKPITSRRYDYIWKRLGRHLPWVATQGVSTHWLRHTTLTWVERNFGYAVARAYAGHTNSHTASATTTYIRADMTEIAKALAALTAEPHPLAMSIQQSCDGSDGDGRW